MVVMKNTLLFLLLSSGTAAFAQFPAGGQSQPAPVIPGTASDNAPKGNAKISGIIIDSTTNKPVEFASIALIDPASNRPVDGTVCDEKGQFTLSKVPAGTFRLLVSFVGYKNKAIPSVTIDGRRQDLNLGKIFVSPEVRTLNEVTVTGQAALVEEKVDRIVYNADKDITSKGGDASDVMRKVPMLSVDLDGNVSLRGSSNVRVLINNKPSTIVASSVADALKQIPADMIKSVEVITSPSAKYDAEGSAGIINIITKKNTLQGFTLNTDAGVGNRGANLGLNGNLRTGKMGFSLSGYGRGNYNVVGSYQNDQTVRNSSGSTSRTVQSADTRSNGMFGQYQLGWDYDLNKNTAITASVRYGLRNNNSFQDKLTTRTFLPGGATGTLGIRDVNVQDYSGTVDVNVDFTKTFNKPQQEFSILTQYSRNNRTNNFIANILNNVDMETITSREKNENLSYNQETTVQADYQTPVKENQMLEFGGKGIFRQVNSDFKYYSATGANGGFNPINSDVRPANTLNYDQNVAATYLSYTYSTKNKYTIKAGARYEYTFINADFTSRTSTSQPTVNVPDYGNLVPSINISKALKGGKTIKLAYNRRLQRPGIQFLNPNVNASNPTNITQGNPNLRPELTDNFEFSTSTYIKSVYLNGSLFARFTGNSIESVRTTDSIRTGDVVNPVLQQVIRTTYYNIGQQESYGLNLFGNATILSKWQIGGGFDAYYTFLTNNSPNPSLKSSNSGFVISGRLFTNVTLKNGWGIQGFGFARGRQVQLQGTQGSFAFHSLGAKKQSANKRGSTALAAENFFNHPFKVRTELASATFTQSSLTSFYNAGVRVNFSYRFGKMSMDGQGFGGGRKKKSVNNDDVKGDGGGDNNGGGQQQGQGNTGGQGGGRPRNR